MPKIMVLLLKCMGQLFGGISRVILHWLLVIHHDPGVFSLNLRGLEDVDFFL